MLCCVVLSRAVSVAARFITLFDVMLFVLGSVVLRCNAGLTTKTGRDASAAEPLIALLPPPGLLLLLLLSLLK
jgi:hypothetical protein